jgi:DDE superfamily endonuclease
MIEEIQGKHPEATALEVWFQDEARVGQKGTLTRRWAPRGSRPRAIRDHRFKSAYLFGAVCPDRDLGVAVVLSRASSEAMDIMLAEVSQAVAPGAHAAVLIDGAGYHIAGDLTVPNNITLVRLPSYSPELNAIEKLWQFMRENILSHRLFDSLDHIIDVCCDAWNRILAEPGRIRSTCGYQWASQVKI